jgi:hypothetical protein
LRSQAAGQTKIELTGEEREILSGSEGPVLQKILRTLVRYAQALGAERFELLTRHHKTLVIDGTGLKKLSVSYPVMWKRKNARPKKCLIGCPHLSLRELRWWTEEICRALRSRGRRKVALATIFCAAPQVLAEFQADREAWAQLKRAGIRVSTTCPEAYMDNPLCAREAVATNSNKLRAFSTAKLYGGEELLDLIVSGR